MQLYAITELPLLEWMKLFGVLKSRQLNLSTTVVRAYSHAITKKITIRTKIKRWVRRGSTNSVWQLTQQTSIIWHAWRPFKLLISCCNTYYLRLFGVLVSAVHLWCPFQWLLNTNYWVTALLMATFVHLYLRNILACFTHPTQHTVQHVEVQKTIGNGMSSCSQQTP